MIERQTTTLQTTIPLRLFTEMEDMVKEGHFQTIDEMVLDALLQFMQTQKNSYRAKTQAQVLTQIQQQRTFSPSAVNAPDSLTVLQEDRSR